MLRLLLRVGVRRCAAGHHKSSNTSLCLLNEQIWGNLQTLALASWNHAVSFSTVVAATESNRKTIANVESVTALLKEHGFSQSHLSIIADKLPVLFNTYSAKGIRPKLEFFLAEGYTRYDLANLISKDPQILTSSLKRLTTNFNLLSNLLLGEDKDAIGAVFASSSWIIRNNPKTYLLPNIKTLLDHGVSRKNISRFLKWYPRSLINNTDQFSRSASLIKEMGFEPSKSTFVMGVHMLSGLTQATWEKKMELYMSLGWSKEETILAFRKNPQCMGHSEEKIRKIMNFFVENLKWKPSQIAFVPVLLSLDFKKRILPRYAVFSILSREGFVGTKLRFTSTLYCRESVFLERYVFKYSDQIPELLGAYKGKLKLTEAKLDS